MSSAGSICHIDSYLEVADFWAWETDANLVLTYLSAGFALRTGLDPTEFVGRSRSQINTRDLNNEIWQHHHQTLQQRKPFNQFRYPLNIANGEVRWFESSGKPHFNDEGDFVGYRGVARDITREVDDRALLRATDRETKLQQALLGHIERVAHIGAWRWIVGQDYLSLSDQVSEILDLPLGEQIRAEQAMRTFTHKSRKKLDEATRQALKSHKPYDLVLELRSVSGNSRWVRVIGDPEVIDGRTARIFGTFQDVTKQRKHELEMRKLALTDTLTGIANRSAFNQRLEHDLRIAKAQQGVFAICIIDLNHFKQVNDQYGHDVGDQILARFASDFSERKHDHWFFARMGGDEFAVLIEHDHPEADLCCEIDKLHTVLRHEIEIDAVVFPVSATGGVAVAPQDGDNATDLLRRADLALYEAKRDSTTNLKRYDSAMEENYRNRVIVVRDFRTALRAGQIVPYYQPVVELETGNITGMEALARWCHPDKGVLTAGHFMDVFDDAKLSIELTNNLLEQICRDMMRWKSEGRQFGRVGLNVTAAVLKQPGFALHVMETLSRYDLLPSALIVEVTETSVINYSSSVITGQLRHLLDAGVSIALDDFGTGYSSLTHLKNLPFNILKIDKSFVKDMGRSPSDTAIIQALISLGADIGYTTVAEGIEERQEAYTLQRMGCERGQGFFFYRPMPRNTIEGLLPTYRPVASFHLAT